MSEIATGKLVIWMRLQAKRITPDGNSTSIMLSAAADRLESQEQTIAALTARAEQAERERDALLTDFSTIERDGLCEVCSFGDSSQISKEDCMKDCCFNYRTRRGLPQEGEGK